MNLEGLVFHRLPYKERDLIVKLLLRSGSCASFYIYGGQGGGKKKKTSIFEIGTMMRVKIQEKMSGKSYSASDLMIPKEYTQLWGPQNIRYDIKAYYLMVLYFELVQKIAIPFHQNEDDLEQDGYFSVLSNALFYLDESITKKNFLPEQHLMLFLVKFLHHLGIMPDSQYCAFCHEPLVCGNGVYFIPERGQFSCQDCHAGDGFDDQLMVNLLTSYQTKFSEYGNLQTHKFRDCDKLLHYFCQQFQLRPIELKSYSLLFHS